MIPPHAITPGRAPLYHGTTRGARRQGSEITSPLQPAETCSSYTPYAVGVWGGEAAPDRLFGGCPPHSWRTATKKERTLEGKALQTSRLTEDRVSRVRWKSSQWQRAKRVALCV